MTMTSMTGAMGATSVAMPTTLGGTQVSSLSISLTHNECLFFNCGFMFFCFCLISHFTIPLIARLYSTEC
jgi:hypothetical protein